MTRRVALGPVIAIGGALLLLVALGLDWYEPDLNAWKAFEVLDLALAALALATIVGALRRVGAGIPAPDLERALLPLSIAALVIVASQILNHPPAAVGTGTEFGIFLALGGAALMVAGAVSTVARISLAVESREGAHDDPTRVVPEDGV